MRMSTLLAGGGFLIEAMPSTLEAITGAIRSLCHAMGIEDDAPDAAREPSLQVVKSRFIEPGLLPESALALIARLRESAGSNGKPTEETAREIHMSARQIYEHAQLAISKTAFQ